MHLLLALLALPPAFAQDPPEDPDDEPQALPWDDPEAVDVDSTQFDFSVSLGGTYMLGNSVSFNGNGTVDLSVVWKKNRLGFEGTGNMGRARVDADGDGVLSEAEKAVPMTITANRFGGNARYDRYLTDRDSVYVLVGGFRDPYAGHHRRLHEQIGYSRTLLRGTRTVKGGDQKLLTSLKGELGLDYAHEHYAPGVDPQEANFAAGRLLLELHHDFNAETSFENTLALYENFSLVGDLRITNLAALSANLSGKVQIQVSHHLLFYNEPLDPKYGKFDHTIMTSLVLNVQ